jgi:hypothetical protein
MTVAEIKDAKAKELIQERDSSFGLVKEAAEAVSYTEADLRISILSVRAVILLRCFNTDYTAISNTRDFTGNIT